MHKTLAMRLFVFIRSLSGEEPALPVNTDDWRTYAIRLQQQYQALRQQYGESERRSARAIARCAIKTIGLRAAADPFPLHLPDGRYIPKDLSQPTRAQLKLLKRYPKQSHICPVCRSAAGRRKIAWHTRELAKLICARGQGSTVYECHLQAGMFHLGRHK
jgi:hypothetical protein